MEPTSSTTAGGIAIFKYFGAPVIFGGLASALAFAVIPPKTATEALRRIVVTVFCSVILGNPLKSWLMQHYDWLIDYGSAVTDPMIFIAAGLPAWWILGAVMRVIEKRADGFAGGMFNRITGTREETISQDRD